MVHETRGFVRDANLPFALWSLNPYMRGAYTPPINCP